MKKNLLITLTFLISLTFAQKKLSDLSPGNFYLNISDYKAKKILPGYSVVPVTWKSGMGGKESIEVNKNGTKDRLKASELPAEFLTEIPESEGGVLMRVFNNEFYYVITDGPICYYIKKTDAEVFELNGPSIYSKQFTSGKYYSIKSDGITDYYSEGITGEIKKLKESELEKRLEEKSLKTKYEADKPKREKKDSVNDYITKTKNWIARYIKML